MHADGVNLARHYENRAERSWDAKSGKRFFTNNYSFGGPRAPIWSFLDSARRDASIALFIDHIRTTMPSTLENFKVSEFLIIFVSQRKMAVNFSRFKMVKCEI